MRRRIRPIRSVTVRARELFASVGWRVQREWGVLGDINYKIESSPTRVRVRPGGVLELKLQVSFNQESEVKRWNVYGEDLDHRSAGNLIGKEARTIPTPKKAARAINKQRIAKESTERYRYR